MADRMDGVVVRADRAVPDLTSDGKATSAVETIAIVVGHPDPGRQTYADALAEAYAKGAHNTGRQARIIRVADLDLPYVRNQSEWKRPNDRDDVSASWEIVTASRHLVFIYPLWLGDMPAKMKSFLEHVSRGGSMISLDGAGRWRPHLKGKTARIIVTMGMPAFAYKWYYFAHSLRSLKRNILAFAGVGPIRSTIIGSVEASAGHRRKWLAKVERLGERGA